MPTSNKDKEYVMKKVGMLVAVLLGLSIVPSQAADQKSLVIIDSYFDSRVSYAQIVKLPGKCLNSGKISKSYSDNYNHGSAMVEVAHKQNPSLPIIAICSAAVGPTGNIADVNGLDFLTALNWVIDNSQSVGAVSFSRSISNNTKVGDCKLASSGLTVKVAKADADIRTAIATLKSKGINVFASTGNSPSKPVNYPACITDVNSVAAGIGPMVYNSSYDDTVDYVGSLPDTGVFNYNSPVFGSIPQTTSSANVAVASLAINNIFTTKVVKVLP